MTAAESGELDETELFDSRWIETNGVCPDEKREWIEFVHKADLSPLAFDTWRQRNEFEERAIRLADASRLAMLEAYGLSDLYFEEV